LVLNEDIEIINSDIFKFGDNLSDEPDLTYVNGSFSHFFVHKKLIDDLGYFDERLLGFGEEDGDIFFRYIEKYNKWIKNSYIGGLNDLRIDIRDEKIKSGVGKYSAFNKDFCFNIENCKYVPDENGIIDSILKSDGSGRIHLHQKAGGSAKPASHETVDAKEHYVYQEGQSVYKFAVTNMAEVSAEIMEKNHLVADDIAWLVPHQANKRIIDATASRMGIGSEKVMLNIHKYGNTTNGTIPLCLWEWESQLKKGDNIILAAFGGGFTRGAVYIKWAYDTK
jgi:hypothetical protein